MRLDFSNVVVTIFPDSDGLTVEVLAHHRLGVDRPFIHAWGLKSSHRKLAERLKNAINAGAVLYNGRIERDVNGQSYVASQCRVFGRTLNADLKRVGF